MFEAHVQEPWFSHLKSGRKQFEGRLKRGDWLTLTPGDTIRFVNDISVTTATVVKLHAFLNFGAAFDTFGQALLPGVDRREAAVAIYAQFYSAELVALHGVLVVELDGHAA
jgi:ASC-1-like (ASCH) protein